MSTSIDEVLRLHKDELLGKANVTSAGIGKSDGERVIIAFVREKLPNYRLQAAAVIPGALEGYRVDVQEAYSEVHYSARITAGHGPAAREF
jgi:hypothetical protein